MKKRNISFVLIAFFMMGLIACNSAKKEAAERKRNEERIEKMEQDKKQFEQNNK